MIKELDRIYAIRLMHMLLTPFEEQKVYEMGMIDDKGNELRLPKTQEEQESFTLLHRLAFKLKQIINDLPSGNFRLKKIAIAMALLRNTNIPTIFQENFESLGHIKNDFLKMLNVAIDNQLTFVEEEAFVEMFEAGLLKEEGEGTTLGAIDSSTPRIKTKQTVELEEKEDE